MHCDQDLLESTSCTHLKKRCTRLPRHYVQQWRHFCLSNFSELDLTISKYQWIFQHKWPIVLEGNQKNGVEKRVGNGWTPLYAKYVDILHDLFSRQIIMAKRDSTAWQKQHEKKNTRHRKSVWWEDREKWARKGQIREKARTTNRWTLPGWKWCVQIALAQRRCDRREDHGILVWGKGSTGRQSPNKREWGGSEVPVKVLILPAGSIYLPPAGRVLHSHTQGLVRALLTVTLHFENFCPSRLGSKNGSSEAWAPSQQALTWTAVSYCSNPSFQRRVN